MQKFIPFVFALLVFGLLGCRSYVPLSSDDDMAPESEMPTNSVIRVYDSALIASILARWHIDTDRLTSDKSGVVTLEWRLLPDGNVSDVQVTHCSADQKFIPIATSTIAELSPFPSWPQEMRQICTNGYRDIHFEFYVP